MNPLVCRVNRSSNTVKKAAVLLSAVMALLAASLPLFSQAAVGTILGGVFDSVRRRDRRRASDDYRRGSRYHTNADDRCGGTVYCSQLALWHLHGARRGQGIPDGRTHQRAARGGLRRSRRSHAVAR